MKLTKDELLKRGYRKNANGSWSKPSALSPGIPDSQPQHHPRCPLEGADAHEEARPHRIGVRITSRRHALLDQDNLYGGAKYLVDELRYAGIIPEDNPEAIRLIVEQERIPRIQEEETLIEISPEASL